jgi:hypothetical protein
MPHKNSMATTIIPLLVATKSVFSDKICLLKEIDELNYLVDYQTAVSQATTTQLVIQTLQI